MTSIDEKVLTGDFKTHIVQPMIDLAEKYGERLITKEEERDDEIPLQGQDVPLLYGLYELSVSAEGKKLGAIEFHIFNITYIFDRNYPPNALFVFNLSSERPNDYSLIEKTSGNAIRQDAIRRVAANDEEVADIATLATRLREERHMSKETVTNPMVPKALEALYLADRTMLLAVRTLQENGQLEALDAQKAAVARTLGAQKADVVATAVQYVLQN